LAGSEKVLEKCFEGPGKSWKSPGKVLDFLVSKSVGTLSLTVMSAQGHLRINKKQGESLIQSVIKTIVAYAFVIRRLVDFWLIFMREKHRAVSLATCWASCLDNHLQGAA